MTDRTSRYSKRVSTELLCAATIAVCTVLSASVLAAQARGGRGGPPVPPVRPAPAAPVTTPAPKPAAVPMARVIGVVFDSVAMRPLRDALVQIVAADDPARIRSAKTDERGAYAVDSLKVGVYLLGFFHARLDSLGLESPLLRVDVQSDGELRAPLAIPSSRTLIAKLCGPTAANNEAQGMFMGFVRSSRGEALSAPARVRAQWLEVTVGPRGIERRNPARYSTTSAAGAFSICGIPTDVKITSRAFVGTDSSGFVELEMPRGGLLYRDMYVGTATKVVLAAPLDTNVGNDRGKATAGATSTFSSSATVLRGNGKIRGTIRNVSGQPIPNARVTVWGSGLDATTNSSGQFALQALPSGTYTLESRALGYAPSRSPVDVLDGTEGSADVAMEVYVPMVDTMRVRANRNPGRDPMAEFDKRKKAGFGYFLDEDAISRRNPIYMSDLLRTTPGLSVSPGQLGGDRVMMRGSAGSGSCAPTVYVNGARVFSDDGVIDNLVNPQDVKAVEVYTRTGSMPIEFQAMSGCGSIVIWTGARRSANDRR